MMHAACIRRTFEGAVYCNIPFEKGWISLQRPWALAMTAKIQIKHSHWKHTPIISSWLGWHGGWNKKSKFGYEILLRDCCSLGAGIRLAGVTNGSTWTPTGIIGPSSSSGGSAALCPEVLLGSVACGPRFCVVGMPATMFITLGSSRFGSRPAARYEIYSYKT